MHCDHHLEGNLYRCVVSRRAFGDINFAQLQFQVVCHVLFVIFPASQDAPRLPGLGHLRHGFASRVLLHTLAVV